MNTLRIVFITVVMSSYGLPVPVVAQSSSEFNLPGATAGKPYSVNVAAVLRETYHLKVETDSRTSVLRWTSVGGELPPGLGMRANGTLTGIPRQPRAQPYRFEVRVVDLTIADSEALKLDFSLVVTARSIRLTRVSAPRLRPMDAIVSPDAGPAANRDPSRPITDVPTDGVSQHHAKELSDSQSAALGQRAMTNPQGFASVPKTNVATASPTIKQRVKPSTNDSGNKTADISYDAELIKPVLRTLTTSDAGLYPATPLPSPKPDISQDVSKEVLSGDKIRGPATIELKNLNVLRYDIRVGKDVTFPAAPDLRLPFIPPIPTQPAKPAAAPAVGGIAPPPPMQYLTPSAP